MFCALDGSLIHDHYEKYDTKTRKIMQLCQLNLLTIDYPMHREYTAIGSCQKG